MSNICPEDLSPESSPTTRGGVRKPRINRFRIKPSDCDHDLLKGTRGDLVKKSFGPFTSEMAVSKFLGQKVGRPHRSFRAWRKGQNYHEEGDLVYENKIRSIDDLPANGVNSTAKRSENYKCRQQTELQPWQPKRKANRPNYFR